MFSMVAIKMFILCIFIGIGFLSRKFNLISENSSSDLSAILVNFTAPCLMIMSMQQEFSTELLDNMILAFVFGFIIHIFLFCVSFFILKLLRKYINITLQQSQIITFVLTFSNISFMGFPIIKGIYGEVGIFYASMVTIFFNLLVFSIGIAILSSVEGENSKFDFKKLINPGIIAALIGVILFVLRVQIPPSIGEFMSMTGNATTPLSMIIIGTLLAKADFKTLFTDKKLYLVSFARLIVIPIFAFLVLRLIITDQTLLGVLVLICGMPAASMTAILAERYDSDKVFASKAVFITTILSVFTIPLLAEIISH